MGAGPDMFVAALYGILFGDAKERAFSNYRLWESLCFIAAYLTTSWVAVFVLATGMVGYGLVEIVIRRSEGVRR
jgi:hypothetical protein